MSFIITTINITDYSPSSFNYEDFKFIFSHNKQIFGDEISFSSKNKLIQKVKLEQKDINFSIKVIKKDFLIGICNFIIPYKNILSKKISSYENNCIINMTDSTKRILLINNFNLKIKIYCDIQYLDKEKINVNSPKLIINKNNKINNAVVNKHYVYSKIIKKSSSKKNNKNQIEASFTSEDSNKKNNLIYSKPKNCINKERSNLFNTEKNINTNNNNSLEYTEDNNSSDTEEALTKSFTLTDDEFSKFVPNLIKERPLNDLSKMNDINEMMSFTKDTIIQFLNYQQDYNDKIKKGIDNYDKYYKLHKKYSQKYANKIKQMNILKHKQKINEIKKTINTNSFVSNLFRIVEIKNNEMDLFSQIRGSNDLEDDFEDNLNINDINNNINEKNKSYNLLNELMNNCISYYRGNEEINKIFPESLIEKYDKNKYNKNDENYLDASLMDSDENNLYNESGECKENNENKKLQYVDSDVNDEIDYELDNYLKEVYQNNKNVKIDKFKKIHDNNYKYGKIQIIIIEEGDKIKIKDNKGVFSIEKFIELNSVIK